MTDPHDTTEDYYTVETNGRDAKGEYVWQYAFNDPDGEKTIILGAPQARYKRLVRRKMRVEGDWEPLKR